MQYSKKRKYIDVKKDSNNSNKDNNSVKNSNKKNSANKNNKHDNIKNKNKKNNVNSNKKSSSKNGNNKKCDNFNNSKKKQSSQMCDFYYMAVSDVMAQELFNIIKELKVFSWKTELWDAAQVIEIQTDEKCSIDIEKIDCFKDEQDKKFLEDNHVKTIYSIRIDESDEKNMIMVFKKIVENLGGFVCSDTEDFLPYIVK